MPSSNLHLPPESAGRALPERLQRALETLSGYDLSDVRVHADSALPARVGARAFAHGCDIYLARGAEETLAHESWHVVQQKQGRVRATRELGSAAVGLGGAGLNDDRELEAEAEVMGQVALLLSLAGDGLPRREGLRFAPVARPSVQRYVKVGAEAYYDLSELRTAVTDAVKLSDENVPGFLDIISDLLNENLSFTSWALLAREIHIRVVGYQAEAELRKLMVACQERRTPAARDATAFAKEQTRIFHNQLFLDEDQRTYRDLGALSDAIEKRKNELYAGLKMIRWTNPVLFAGEAGLIEDFPIYQWLTGKIQIPYKMNCWESVLFALVRTGLVKKEYMTWCLRTLSGSLPELKIDNPLRLVTWAMKNRDYCFVSPANAEELPLMFSSRIEPQEHDPRTSICIPGSMIIPRGRILFFGARCEHVALSTGRKVKLTSALAQEHFQTSWGHGMIELDGNSGTLRERALEDLWECKKLYLQTILTVAPFPVVSTAGTVKLRVPKDGMVSVKVKLKRREILNQAKQPIYKKKMETKARRDEELERLGNEKTRLRKAKQQDGISNEELDSLDQQLKAATQKGQELEALSAKEQKEADEEASAAGKKALTTYIAWVEKNPELFNWKTMEYSAQDPYKGLVAFPHSID